MAIRRTTRSRPWSVADPIGQKFLTAFVGQEVIGDQRVFGQQLGYLTDDFGDAPEPFPVTLADDGARHAVVDGFHLGAAADLDFDGQPSPTANGDDDDGEDDEDGVSFDTPLMIGQEATITVTASAAGQLDAWIDFNGDDDWSDPSDQIFVSQALVAGDNELTFSVPADGSHGYSYARFRFSTAGGLSLDGPAADGEVEDYRVVIGRDWTPLQLDFNHELESPTAEGYVPVVSRSYNEGRGFGWSDADEVSTIELTTFSDPLLGDAHHGADATFLVDAPAGDYIVNLTMYGYSDDINIYAEDSLVIEEFSPRGYAENIGFPVTVADGQLTLRLESTARIPIIGWTIQSLDLNTAPVATHALSAVGTHFMGSGATPSSLITIGQSSGTLLTEDASPLYFGRQVRADATGNFTFDVQPPGVAGTISITTAEVTGAGQGAITHTIESAELQLDFNHELESPTAEGYVPVVSRSYNEGRGFGWSDADEVSTIELTTFSDPLLGDAHHGADATFLVDAPAGDYIVNLTMYGYSDDINIYAEDSLVIEEFSPRGYAENIGFPVTVADGQLTLRLESTARIPIIGWTIQSLDLNTAPVATHALSAVGTHFMGSGATPSSLITIGQSSGTLLTEDASPLYFGRQVRADATGNFTFDVQPPGVAGTISITTAEVTGAGQGAITHTIESAELQLDFNHELESPTAEGYVPVVSRSYNEGRGFGWSDADEVSTIELTTFSDPLLGDAHHGADATFLVDAPAGDYIVNLTMYGYSDDINIYAEDSLVIEEFSPRGYAENIGFPVTVADGQLTLRLESTARIPIIGWTIQSLDLNTAPVATHALSAVGTHFMGSGATPSSLITIGQSSGTLLTEDASPLYFGRQVRADATGNFTFDVQPPGVAGTISITTAEVTGAGQGAITHTIESAELQLDFNHELESPTAEGYVPVVSRSYNEGRGFGWSDADEVSTIELTTFSDPLLGDAHHGADATFLVDAPAGDYIVNLTMYGYSDDINIYAEDSLVIEEFSPRGYAENIGFPVTVADGQLTLRLESTARIPIIGWTIQSLDLNTAPVATHALSAVGTHFMGSGATPSSLITIGQSSGTLLTEDASPLYFGRQVRADATGNFTFDVQPPGVAGTISITTAEVTGAGQGAITHTIESAELQLDFNHELESPTAEGYVPVVSRSYNEGRGFGWSDADEVSTIELTTFSDPLLGDAHHGADATFLVDAPAGDYIVNLTMYGYSDDINIYAEDSLVIEEFSPRGYAENIGFPVTVADGQLTLRLESTARIPIIGWTIQSLDLNTAPVATHTLSGPTGGSLFEAVGATPETFVTVSSDVGTITTADASDLYYGHQVLSDGLGRFTVNIDIPDLGEGVTIETEEVTGGGRGTYTFFLPENSLRLDFNSDTSPTAAGFLGVPPTTVYSPSLGYGWETAAVSWDLGEPNCALAGHASWQRQHVPR